jgi:O-antigen/teichoic acid export membrane protein
MEKPEPQIPSPELFFIAKGAGIVFLGSLIGNGLRYLFQIIVARSLGAELFGLFFLGLTAYTIAEMFSELGLPNGVIRYIALYQGLGDRSRTKGIIFLACRAVALSGMAVGSLLFFLSRVLSFHVFGNPGLIPILKYFALILPFSALGTILLFSLQGFKAIKYKIYAGEFFEPFLRILAVMGVLLMGWGLKGVLLSYWAVTLLTVIVILYYLKKVFPALGEGSVRPVYETKKILSFSWPLLFVYFIGYLLLATDTFMLGIFRTSGEVGIYGAAQRTGLLCSLVLTSFNSIFAPVIADLYNRKKLAEMERIFKLVSKWAFSATLPICSIICLLPKNILSVFGPAFSRGAGALTVLALGWLVHSFFGTTGTILTMSGRTKLHLANFSFLLLCNIFLNYVLIPSYGILGAALATSASLLLIDLVTSWQVYYVLKIHPFRKDDGKPLLAAGIAALVALALIRRIPHDNESLFPLAIIGLLYFGIYLTLFQLLRINEEEKNILKGIIKKVRGIR